MVFPHRFTIPLVGCNPIISTHTNVLLLFNYLLIYSSHENDVSLWLLKEVFSLFINIFRVREIKKLKSHSTCRLAVDNILYDSEKSVCMDRRRKSFYFFTKRAENFSSTSLNDFFALLILATTKEITAEKKKGKIHKNWFTRFFPLLCLRHHHHDTTMM